MSVEPGRANPRGASRGWVWAFASVSVAALLVAAYVAFAPPPSGAAAVLRLLNSDDPGKRELGAWLTTERRVPRGVEFIARQLDLRAEPVADVRASYVHALGRFGGRRYYPTVAALLSDEPQGLVRQAAWPTAARIDPARFRQLAESCPASDDPWEQIGLACAWLRVEDYRGVPALLHWARQGDAEQKPVACGGLAQGVVPLLEAAGRWPLDAAVGEGLAWPPELLTEVERRCAGLDLQRMANQTRPHRAAARQLERDALRMTSARNWIARLLFSF